MRSANVKKLFISALGVVAFFATDKMNLGSAEECSVIFSANKQHVTFVGKCSSGAVATGLKGQCSARTRYIWQNATGDMSSADFKGVVGIIAMGEHKDEISLTEVSRAMADEQGYLTFHGLPCKDSYAQNLRSIFYHNKTDLPNHNPFIERCQTGRDAVTFDQYKQDFLSDNSPETINGKLTYSDVTGGTCMRLNLNTPVEIKVSGLGFGYVDPETEEKKNDAEGFKELLNTEPLAFAQNNIIIEAEGIEVKISGDKLIPMKSGDSDKLRIILARKYFTGLNLTFRITDAKKAQYSLADQNVSTGRVTRPAKNPGRIFVKRKMENSSLVQISGDELPSSLQGKTQIFVKPEQSKVNIQHKANHVYRFVWPEKTSGDIASFPLEIDTEKAGSDNYEKWVGTIEYNYATKNVRLIENGGTGLWVTSGNVSLQKSYPDYYPLIRLEFASNLPFDLTAGMITVRQKWISEGTGKTEYDNLQISQFNKLDAAKYTIKVQSMVTRAARSRHLVVTVREDGSVNPLNRVIEPKKNTANCNASDWFAAVWVCSKLDFAEKSVPDLLVTVRNPGSSDVIAVKRANAANVSIGSQTIVEDKPDAAIPYKRYKIKFAANALETITATEPLRLRVERKDNSRQNQVESSEELNFTIDWSKSENDLTVTFAPFRPFVREAALPIKVNYNTANVFKTVKPVSDLTGLSIKLNDVPVSMVPSGTNLASADSNGKFKVALNKTDTGNFLPTGNQIKIVFDPGKPYCTYRENFSLSDFRNLSELELKLTQCYLPDINLTVEGATSPIATQNIRIAAGADAVQTSNVQMTLTSNQGSVSTYKLQFNQVLPNLNNTLPALEIVNLTGFSNYSASALAANQLQNISGVLAIAHKAVLTPNLANTGGLTYPQLKLTLNGGEALPDLTAENHTHIKLYRLAGEQKTEIVSFEIKKPGDASLYEIKILDPVPETLKNLPIIVSVTGYSEWLLSEQQTIPQWNVSTPWQVSMAMQKNISGQNVPITLLDTKGLEIGHDEIISGKISMGGFLGIASEGGQLRKLAEGYGLVFGEGPEFTETSLEITEIAAAGDYGKFKNWSGKIRKDSNGLVLFSENGSTWGKNIKLVPDFLRDTIKIDQGSITDSVVQNKLPVLDSENKKIGEVSITASAQYSGYYVIKSKEIPAAGKTDLRMIFCYALACAQDAAFSINELNEIVFDSAVSKLYANAKAELMTNQPAAPGIDIAAVFKYSPAPPGTIAWKFTIKGNDTLGVYFKDAAIKIDDIETPFDIKAETPESEGTSTVKAFVEISAASLAGKNFSNLQLSFLRKTDTSKGLLGYKKSEDYKLNLIGAAGPVSLKGEGDSEPNVIVLSPNDYAQGIVYFKRKPEDAPLPNYSGGLVVKKGEDSKAVEITSIGKGGKHLIEVPSETNSSDVLELMAMESGKNPVKMRGSANKIEFEFNQIWKNEFFVTAPNIVASELSAKISKFAASPNYDNRYSWKAPSGYTSEHPQPPLPWTPYADDYQTYTVTPEGKNPITVTVQVTQKLYVGKDWKHPNPPSGTNPNDKGKLRLDSPYHAVPIPFLQLPPENKDTGNRWISASDDSKYKIGHCLHKPGETCADGPEGFPIAVQGKCNSHAYGKTERDFSDLGSFLGTKIYSPGRGKIISLGESGNMGNTVKLEITAHNGKKYNITLGHLGGFASDLYIDKEVFKGDVIASVGRSGTTGGSVIFALGAQEVITGKHIDPITVWNFPGGPGGSPVAATNTTPASETLQYPPLKLALQGEGVLPDLTQNPTNHLSISRLDNGSETPLQIKPGSLSKLGENYTFQLAGDVPSANKNNKLIVRIKGFEGWQAVNQEFTPDWQNWTVPITLVATQAPVEGEITLKDNKGFDILPEEVKSLKISSGGTLSSLTLGLAGTDEESVPVSNGRFKITISDLQEFSGEKNLELTEIKDSGGSSAFKPWSGQIRKVNQAFSFKSDDQNDWKPNIYLKPNFLRDTIRIELNGLPTPDAKIPVLDKDINVKYVNLVQHANNPGYFLIYSKEFTSTTSENYKMIFFNRTKYAQDLNFSVGEGFSVTLRSQPSDMYDNLQTGNTANPNSTNLSRVVVMNPASESSKKFKWNFSLTGSEYMGVFLKDGKVYIGDEGFDIKMQHDGDLGAPTQHVYVEYTPECFFEHDLWKIPIFIGRNKLSHIGLLGYEGLADISIDASNISNFNSSLSGGTPNIKYSLNEKKGPQGIMSIFKQTGENFEPFLGFNGKFQIEKNGSVLAAIHTEALSEDINKYLAISPENISAESLMNAELFLVDLSNQNMKYGLRYTIANRFEILMDGQWGSKISTKSLGIDVFSSNGTIDEGKLKKYLNPSGSGVDFHQHPCDAKIKSQGYESSDTQNCLKNSLPGKIVNQIFDADSFAKIAESENPNSKRFLEFMKSFKGTEAKRLEASQRISKCICFVFTNWMHARIENIPNISEDFGDYIIDEAAKGRITIAGDGYPCIGVLPDWYHFRDGFDNWAKVTNPGEFAETVTESKNVGHYRWFQYGHSVIMYKKDTKWYFLDHQYPNTSRPVQTGNTGNVRK